jgi:hypothetical protein
VRTGAGNVAGNDGNRGRFFMKRWDKVLYASFFFLLAVIGSLQGGPAGFPRWIFLLLAVVTVVYLLNKDKVDKSFRK